jgi:3-methyladenine DNA glycosylase AlkD
MEVEHIIANLQQHANPQNVEGMARFGIRPAQVLGISIPTLRKMVKEIGRNHGLALELWDSEIHEARILASMIDEPRLVTLQQMEAWVNNFDSWDVCDQVCGNLFDKTPYAYQKAVEWSHQEKEFVRRAGFVMIAELAVHDKQALDEAFLQFFPLIKQYADDERNFVKKAVNWALRQIGKRNSRLHTLALECARDIQNMDSKTAQWVAKDAIRELKAKEPAWKGLTGLFSGIVESVLPTHVIH